jgi:predicted ATPase
MKRSYDLLSEAEQAMWCRVSVFAGSLDLGAAEAVCAGGGIAPETVVDLVDALLAKSILSRSPGHGQARYRLLDTIGEFGLSKLRAEGTERQFRARHRDWYAALAARQEAHGPGRAEWIAVLETDHENVRAAIDFCLAEVSELIAGAELACARVSEAFDTEACADIPDPRRRGDLWLMRPIAGCTWSSTT